MRCRRALLLLVCLGVAAALGAGMPAKAAKLAGDEILIGYLNPLTGWASALGTQNEIAVAVAVDEINASGGVSGVPLKVAKFDTGSDPVRARELMAHLAKNPRVVAVLGPLLDSECAAAFPRANRLGIVAVSAASTAPGIAAANRPWTFRNALDRVRILRPALEVWVQRYGIRRAAIAYGRDEPFSKWAATQVLPSLFARYHLQLVARAGLQAEAHAVREQAARIQAAKADGLILAASVDVSLALLRELHGGGMRIPVLLGADSTVPSYARQGKAAVERTTAAATFWAGKPDARVSSFVKRYADRASGMLPASQAANIYDNIFIIKDAIEKGGVTNLPTRFAEDRAKIRDWWARLRDYRGVAGLTSMTPEGDADKQVYVLEVRDGAWTKVTTVPR